MSIIDFDESEKRAVSSTDTTGRMQDVTFLNLQGFKINKQKNELNTNATIPTSPPSLHFTSHILFSVRKIRGG